MELYDELFEYELIQKIGEPILDQLLDMQEQSGVCEDSQPIRIQITSPEFSDLPEGSDCSGMVDFHMANSDFLRKLEEYLQDRLDEWNHPTILQ